MHLPRSAHPVVSTLTADLLPAPEHLADHWVEQLRGPVRFLDTVRRLERDGVVQYVECGPAPVLGTLAATCVVADPAGGFVASLRTDHDEASALHEAVAAAFAAGAGLRWDLLVPWAPTRVRVPGHVFARDHHWATGSGVPARESRRADAWWDAVADERVDDLARMLDVPAADRDALATVAPYLAGLRRDLVAPPTERDPVLEIRWLPVDLPAAGVSGSWTVVSSRAEGEHLARALRVAGASTTRVLPVSDALQLGVLEDTGTTGVLVDLCDVSCARPGELAGVPGVRDALRIAQAAASAPAGPVVWGLTSASADVVDGDVVEPAAASLWGLAQVAALETDHRWRGLVDLGGPLDADAAARVAGVLASGTEEHVALRPGTTCARRLVPADLSGQAWRPRGAVLVTGSGAVATHLTRWLARHGADDVVLVSRRLDGRRRAVRVHARSCDVTDREVVQGLLAGLADAGLTPSAVVHGAGVLDDRLLPDVDAASVRPWPTRS